MEIFLSGLIATSLMTAFSYLVSAWSNSQFKEPELLNLLITSSTSIPLKLPKKSITGWIIHYSIGYFFVVIFYLIWNKTNWDPSLLTGAVFGSIAGIVGLTGWKIFFRLNARPPLIDYKGFYIQIIFAHIIFGIGAALPSLL